MYRNKVINYSSTYLLLMFLLFNATTSFAQKIVESSEQSAGFSFATDSNIAEPVIHYQQNIQMLSSMKDKPSLSIFGDGLVLVHYPVYMKKAGDYEMRLEDAELANLIQTLSSNGIMDFDEQKVKGKVDSYKKALKAKGQFYGISDAVETVINIRLDEFQKNKASKKLKDFHKEFKWKNIEHDASRYKNESKITNANKSVTRLKELMKDVRLVNKDAR